MTATTGAAVGPLLGGLTTNHSTWRWVFYLNLPIGVSKYRAHVLSRQHILIKKAGAFISLFLSLHMNYQRDQTWKQRLVRLDIAGNVIFIAAVIAQTWGGEGPYTTGERIISLFPLSLASSELDSSSRLKGPLARSHHSRAG